MSGFLFWANARQQRAESETSAMLGVFFFFKDGNIWKWIEESKMRTVKWRDLYLLMPWRWSHAIRKLGTASYM
jgi:hypothetical protein